MKILKIPTYVGISVLLFFGLAIPSLAVPAFQVYSPDATAGDLFADQDTWFVNSTSFELWVIGAYSRNADLLTDVTLLVSVPDGQSGTLSISGGDGAILLYTKTATSYAGVFNPNANADIDLLTNETGLDGYSDKSFVPEPDVTHFNNHYPLQDGVSDFLLYGLGDFDEVEKVSDYNADNGGSITLSNTFGEIKKYDVEFSGFDWVHFDAYGYLIKDGNIELGLEATIELDATWLISPGSHDTTAIPAPGAVLLGSIGMAFVGWLKRRRTL